MTYRTPWSMIRDNEKKLGNVIQSTNSPKTKNDYAIKSPWSIIRDNEKKLGNVIQSTNSPKTKNDYAIKWNTEIQNKFLLDTGIYRIQ